MIDGLDPDADKHKKTYKVTAEELLGSMSSEQFEALTKHFCLKCSCNLPKVQN